MKITKNIIICLSVYLAACLMLMSQTSYAGDAGYAQFVNGNVQITSATGQTSVLKKGGAIKEGDTLTTAKASSAQIKMQDGGLIAVRSDTQLKFDTFKFNGTQDGSERSFFSLLKGGFRAVTGLIGQVNKSSFRISTTVATIGIRGTDHETFVVTAGSPMAEVVPIGTYNKVNSGETTMTTAKGTISILPNQMGYAGAADQMPELKPLNTNIFTVSDRPLEEAKDDKKEGEDVRKTAKAGDTAKITATGVASASGNESNVKNGSVTGISWARWDKNSFKISNQDTGLNSPGAANGLNSPGAANGLNIPGAANGLNIPGAANGLNIPGAARALVNSGVAAARK